MELSLLDLEKSLRQLNKNGVKSMEDWTAYYSNNPDDDYNLIVEILFKDEDIAMISNGIDGLELKWYASNADVKVPVEWLLSL